MITNEEIIEEIQNKAKEYGYGCRNPGIDKNVKIYCGKDKNGDDIYNSNNSGISNGHIFLEFNQSNKKLLQIKIERLYRICLSKEEFSVTFVNSNTLGGQTVPQFNIKFNPSEKQPFTDYDEMKKVIEYWLQNDGELP